MLMVNELNSTNQGNIESIKIENEEVYTTTQKIKSDTMELFEGVARKHAGFRDSFDDALKKTLLAHIALIRLGEYVQSILDKIRIGVAKPLSNLLTQLDSDQFQSEPELVQVLKPVRDFMVKYAVIDENSYEDKAELLNDYVNNILPIVAKIIDETKMTKENNIVSPQETPTDSIDSRSYKQRVADINETTAKVVIAKPTPESIKRAKEIMAERKEREKKQEQERKQKEAEEQEQELQHK